MKTDCYSPWQEMFRLESVIETAKDKLKMCADDVARAVVSTTESLPMTIKTAGCVYEIAKRNLANARVELDYFMNRGDGTT